MTAYTAPMADPTDVTGRRIGAWFIDLLIYLMVMFALAQIFGGAQLKSADFSTRGAAESFCDGIRNTTGDPCFTTPDGDQFSALVVEDLWRSPLFWGLHLVAYIVIQGLAGASVGKLAVGLRVVDEQGNQAGLGRSAVRTVLWVVDAVTIALPIVGGIMILTTRGHRRVGDMAAGTYVVPKEQVGRPPMSAGPAGAMAGSGWATPPAPGSPGSWPASSPASSPMGSDGIWSPPAQGSSAASSPAPSMTTSASSDDGPTWDQARNSWIQYDRDQQAWMQWSDSRQSWGPIDQ